MKEADEKQEKPVLQKKEWRRKEKYAKKNKWYKKGGHSSVLFLSATPQSELRNQIQEEIVKTQFKIKLIKKSGTKLSRPPTEK